MKFTKMHGTGNDYVLVNCLEETVEDASGVARALSCRHTGIGSDGLILIRPSAIAAVRMEVYNADGSRAQMCGNGIRCVAKYAYDHGLTAETDIPIDTDDGLKRAHCVLAGGTVTRVRIDMGEPRFAPGDMPVSLEADEVIEAPIEINGRYLTMTCVSMGNPHAVFFVDSLEDVDLPSDGPAMESHPLFPERVNAHFVQVKRPDRVAVVTWERGSGPTRACGTGVSAVCVAGVRTNRTQRHITAEVPGGELELHWRENNHVYMIGAAVEVFSGSWQAGVDRSG